MCGGSASWGPPLTAPESSQCPAWAAWKRPASPQGCESVAGRTGAALQELQLVDQQLVVVSNLQGLLCFDLPAFEVRRHVVVRPKLLVVHIRLGSPDTVIVALHVVAPAVPLGVVVQYREICVLM
eukprot:CAMPEP_0117689704 /NCGR_PEP_ID=MMETSP0804-20121206/24665_1 /TAXON_ID=1074897 /ORGANISM="Tetraselmis astigmatica, Strain CCMP880" /LENGTH=124 /DNA_ID=CAMNT_0005502561 /DNA_START=360 /DNA_END=735 /DNA_ORIENTATION=-